MAGKFNKRLDWSGENDRGYFWGKITESTV